MGTSKNSLSPYSLAIFSSGKAEDGVILASSMPTDDNEARRKKGSEDGGMEFFEVPYATRAWIRVICYCHANGSCDFDYKACGYKVNRKSE